MRMVLPCPNVGEAVTSRVLRREEKSTVPQQAGNRKQERTSDAKRRARAAIARYILFFSCTIGNTLI